MAQAEQFQWSLETSSFQPNPSPSNGGLSSGGLRDPSPCPQGSGAMDRAMATLPDYLSIEDVWTLDDAAAALPWEFALTLQGVPLRYALPRHGSAGAWRIQNNDAFRDALQRTEKNDLPCFDPWSAILKLVIADFDLLPDSFVSWDQFREYLEWKYGRMGLVLESPSGKAKVFFVVKAPGARMTKEIALDTLEHLLEEDERGAIDRGASALTQFFLREEAFSLLRERLDGLPVFPAILDSTEAPERPRKWLLYTGDLPDLGLDDFKTFIVRFILGASKRALAELTVSQPYLVAQARLNGFDLPNAGSAVTKASRALAFLVKAGLLERTSQKYRPGVKGKGYRVAGTLGELAEQILKEHPHKDHVPPTTIPDHDWNRTLLRESNYHRSQESFEAWFYSLDGWREGDREKQMRGVWKWHENRDRVISGQG